MNGKATLQKKNKSKNWSESALKVKLGIRKTKNIEDLL